MLTLLYVLLGLYLLASPLIALVAIVQWVTKKPAKAISSGPTFIDGYRKGVHESFDYVRGIEGPIAPEALNEIEASLVGEGKAYVPAALQQQPGAWLSQPVHIPGMELPDREPDSSAEPLETAPQFTDIEAKEAAAVPEPVLAPESSVFTHKLSAMSGINLLLSLSSLLFVAAGIAFIASPFSDSGKLIVLVGIVALFYGGGIALYKTIERLRPAAVSFVGTGLALIPFLGIAFVQYASMSVPAVWLLISVIGLVAYVAAAFILQSSVVSYLSMAFLLSLTSSVVANASLPVVYYFVSFIALSLCASVIAHSKPQWVPQLFARPVAQTGNIITPIAAGVSLLWLGKLSIHEYELVFCLTTLQYIVAWVQTRATWHEQAARALAQFTALLFIYDFAGGFTVAFGLGLLETAVLQHAYSLVRWAKTTQSHIEFNWSVGMLVLQAVALAWWPDKWMWVVATVTVLATSICTVAISRRYEFGSATLYALFVLPILVGLSAAEPHWPYGSVGAWYAVMAAGMVGALYVLRSRVGVVMSSLLHIGFWLFAAAAFIAGFIESTRAVSIGLLVATVIMALGMSYLTARPKLMVLVAALVPVVLFRACIGNADPAYNVLIIFAGAAALLYVAAGVQLLLADRLRGNIALMAGHVYVLPAVMLGIPAAYMPLATWQQILIAAVLAVASYGFWLVARLDRRAPMRQSVHRVFCATYYVFALLMSLQLPAWWLALVILVGVILLWEASYLYVNATLTGVANVGVVWMLWVAFSATAPADFPVALWAFGLAMIGFYGAALALRARGDDQRHQIMLWSVWVASIASFVAGYTAPDYIVIASMLLLGGAFTMIQEGARTKYLPLIEFGVYISAFGVCQIIGEIAPDTTAVFYAHIAALAVAIMAAVNGNDTTRYQLAAGILTAFVGGAALQDGGGYSMLFLTEQILLSVAGAMTKSRWATWWGVGGAVFAVFYYLQESPALLFTLLGVAIVGFVIMRLSHKSDDTHGA